MEQTAVDVHVTTVPKHLPIYMYLLYVSAHLIKNTY